MNQDTRTILENNNFAVLSTVNEAGVPWGTPVHMAFDDRRLYWISADEAVHSKNVAQNGKVFLVVFNPDQTTDRSQRAALYVETTARALEGDEAVAAHDVYASRFTTSHLPGNGDGAHIYAAPLGVLNQAKTNGKMMYYQPKDGETA